MGRSSALILQAVCLAGWLTERQADAYVIAAKRHDREAASAGSLSVRKNRQTFDSLCYSSSWSRSKLLEEKEQIYCPGRRSCRSPHPTSDQLPLPVARAWLVKAGHHEQWERNRTEQFIFSDTVMWGWWGGGSCFHQQWHLKDTLQRCLENSDEPAWPHWVWGQGWVTSCLSVTAGYMCCCFFLWGGAQWGHYSRNIICKLV